MGVMELGIRKSSSVSFMSAVYAMVCTRQLVLGCAQWLPVIMIILLFYYTVRGARGQDWWS